MQANQPPFRPSSHLLDDVCREWKAHHLFKEGHDLLICATQLVGSHFQHLPACSQQRKRQGGIGARGQDNTQLGRKMLHEISERLVHLRLGDHVIVVQDQQKLFASTGQAIDERLQDVAQWRFGRLLRLQIGQQLSTETWLHGIQCRERIGPEERRLIIVLVQGNPGHQGSLRFHLWERLHPGREQGGLAEASGSRDEGEFASQAVIEQGGQLGARDEGMG